MAEPAQESVVLKLHQGGVLFVIQRCRFRFEQWQKATEEGALAQFTFTKGAVTHLPTVLALFFLSFPRVKGLQDFIPQETFLHA